MARFEHDDRFWEIERDGRSLRIRFGRRGEPGEQVSHKALDEHEALLEYEELVESKKREGFRSVEQGSDELGEIEPGLMAAVVEALDLERLDTAEGAEALRAAWTVLGDWLSARGDVRGELISIDETLAYVDAPSAGRLIARRDKLLAKWLPRWLGQFYKLDGVDRPIHLAWDHGFIAAARVGTKPGRLDLSRWSLGLRDLAEVLDTVLSTPLSYPLQQLRIAELDPRSRRDLGPVLPMLGEHPHPALLRLELGGVARGRWVRDSTGNMVQRKALARIGQLAPLARASSFAPRLAALRIIGRELRVFPPLPQLRVLELHVPAFDEELRAWLTDGQWPRLERLWLRSAGSSEPWALADGAALDALLDNLARSPLRELGLQGRTAIERVVWRAVMAPLELDELRLFGLGEDSVDTLLDADPYLGGVERIVLEDTEITARWPELKAHYGDRIHRCTEMFGVIGEHTGNMLFESLYDTAGWYV